jgi:hypothetical protein
VVTAAGRRHGGGGNGDGNSDCNGDGDGDHNADDTGGRNTPGKPESLRAAGGEVSGALWATRRARHTCGRTWVGAPLSAPPSVQMKIAAHWLQ